MFIIFYIREMENLTDKVISQEQDIASKEFEFSVLPPIITVILAPSWCCLVAGYIIKGISFSNLPGLIFTFFIMIYLAKNLRITYLMLRRLPSIILTDEKITVAQKKYSIYWKDVTSIQMAISDGMNFRPKYIIINVRDNWKYIKEIKNPIIKYYRWYTRNWSYSPFDINLFFVKGDNDEIYHTVLKYYQNNRGF
jgi:hypothetical protein